MPSFVKIEMQSTVTGPLNPAYMDFSFGAGFTNGPADNMRVVAYAAACLGIFADESCSISACFVKDAVSAPFLAVAFTVSDYDTARSAINTFVGSAVVKAMSAYGVSVGPTSATPSGRGDSVCVNTKCATGGRNSRGRHFSPFANRDTVNNQGLLNPASCVPLEKAYACAMGLASGGGALPSITPGVYSRTTSTLYPIINAQVNRIPSRLRSRTK